MKRKDLLEDRKVKLWLSGFGSKDNTISAYLSALQDYTEFTGKTPSQLIDEAKADIKAGKLMDERAIFEDYNFFNSFLIGAGLAPKTISLRLVGVRSFFNKFYVDVPNVQIKTRAKPLKKHEAIPGKDDIREALNVCNPLQAAIVLTGVSSGLGAEEIINLELKTFNEGYDPGTEICTMDLRRQKSETNFITFMSPECTRAVRRYLGYRSRTIKARDQRRERQLAKQRITPDSYLFISEKVPEQYHETLDEELRKLTTNAVMKMYREISAKAQKNTPGGCWNLIRSHNMRKYFNSALLNAGADFFFVDYCMGHTLDDTRAAYFRASPEKLREQYEKYVPYLIIQKALDISESPEYQKIKNEKQILEGETVRHIVERHELQDLRKRVQELEDEREIKEKGIEIVNSIMNDEETRELWEKFVKKFSKE